MEEKELFDSQNKVGGGRENQLDKKPIESVDFQQDKPIKKTLSFTLGGGDF